jgi:hypothetical protein
MLQREYQQILPSTPSPLNVKIPHPMSERTFSFLADDSDLDPIGSLHLLTLYPSPSTSERV